MTELYQRHNYINKDISMLKTTIREYDMVEGGYSVIKEFSLLSPDIINNLQTNYTKKGRHIEIGRLQKEDKELVQNMMDGFIECRKAFFRNNNLKEENVLSIKKDAIFVYNTNITSTEFGKYITFRPKGKYSCYMRLNNVEFYYSIWEDKLDVKGLGDNYHPLFDKIKYFIRVSDKLSKFDMYKVLKKFRSDYLNLNLDLDFYREMNNSCANSETKQFDFRIKNIFQSTSLTISDISDDMIDYLDISYNYINFIIPLINNFI